MKLTYNYFLSNSSNNLTKKVLEEYVKFPDSQCGGPLFFIIMMNVLLTHTESASEALIKNLRNLNLQKLTGKNVDKAVSLAWGAIQRLTNVNCLPQDIVSILISVFQTSSVDAFNATFCSVETTRCVALATQGTGIAMPTITADQVLSLAGSTYRLIIEEGAWTGSSTPGESVFPAKTGSVTPKKKICWNCGSNKHLLPG